MRALTNLPATTTSDLVPGVMADDPFSWLIHLSSSSGGMSVEINSLLYILSLAHPQFLGHVHRRGGLLFGVGLGVSIALDLSGSSEVFLRNSKEKMLTIN
jgi:hypothetical protein